MIKLRNIVKYYNRNRSNQYQVCKNISLEFEESGLVVILGPSGSGKTTLLNILSGMDKYQSGQYDFNGEIFEKYRSRKWDKLRRNEIGYIYQDYHLLKELTVGENIEIVLKMCGLTDIVVIERRIEELLDVVGLLEYKDRLAKQLSGGQQQRVAFVRALAKDPKIILADEPTGNVDSKTTIELMNVLKSISQTKLVIMVTHERKLADHYADRIIEIENGMIATDVENKQKKDLALLQEQIIYLKDYDTSKVMSDQLEVKRYVKDKNPTKMDVSLIERNETLYVHVESKLNKKLKFVNQENEIEIKDESSKNAIITQPINIEPLVKENAVAPKAAITLRDSLRYARRKFNSLTYGGKLLFFVLAIVGIIASLGIGMLGEVNRVEQTIASENRNYIQVTTDRISYEELLAFDQIEGVEQVVLINREMRFYIESEKYYEINSSLQLSALPVDIEYLDETKIMYGEMPDDYEIVIDKSIADEMIYLYKIRGIETYEDILNCSFKLQASGADTDLPHDNALYFQISGIAEDFSRSVWMKEDLMYSFVTPNLISDSVLGEYFTIIEGTMPTNIREVVLHEESPFLRMENRPLSIGITTGEYNISGVYKYTKAEHDYNFENLIVTSFDNLIHEYYANNYLNKNKYVFYLYSSDVETSLNEIRENGFRAENKYLYEKEDNQIIKFDDNINIYVLSISGIIASAISIYFIMRTSLISRVYEVSVYRTLGASKWNIRKMFFVEILLTTTYSAIVGYVIMTLLLLQAEASVAGGVDLVHFTLYSFLMGVLGIYAINILFGLLPINILLRSTPAEIMKRFDL